MCTRFTLHHEESEIIERFGVQQVAMEISNRYNIAPSQQVAVVTMSSPRLLSGMKWGLIPSWAKDMSIGSKLLNARAETLQEKPSFRAALKKRRCLIPGDGFYEWLAVGKKKQPVHIRRKDRELFAFAGLWEEWKSPYGQSVRSCTMVTVAANKTMSSIHDRMPAILSRDDEASWLDNADIEAAEAMMMLNPYDDSLLETYLVSPEVNSSRADRPDYILLAEPRDALTLDF